MSYLTLGGNTTTAAGVTILAATGISAGTLNTIWEVTTIFITVGVLLIMSQFFRRTAIEPVMMPSGKYRPWLTLNGRPVGRRFKNR